MTTPNLQDIAGQKPPVKKKTEPTRVRQPGSDIVVTTAFELIGIALLSLLAGASDQMGTVVVIVMSGFLLGWLLFNARTLQGWIQGL
jgi:hypothetical protein